MNIGFGRLSILWVLLLQNDVDEVFYDLKRVNLSLLVHPLIVPHHCAGIGWDNCNLPTPT